MPISGVIDMGVNSNYADTHLGLNSYRKQF